jgi:hypothetical protein
LNVVLILADLEQDHAQWPVRAGISQTTPSH